MDGSFTKKRYRITHLPSDPHFHRSAKFSESIKPGYKDNSLLKYTNSKKSVETLEKNLQANKQTLENSLSKHRSLNEKVKSFTSEYFDYLRILGNYEEDFKLKNESASIIQKCFRRFLIKKFFQERTVGKLRPDLNRNIMDLDLQAQYCFWNIGKNACLCAVKIQRWVRRLFCLAKIKRITKVYLVFKERKEFQSVSTIKLAISHFKCKEILNAKKRNFFIKNKFQNIRRNLAILKIKQIVKREKINLRLMKLKIRKYRRMSFMKGFEKRVRKNSSLTETSDNSIKKGKKMPAIEEDLQSNRSDLEEKFKVFKESELKKEKISMGYIAHSISRNRFRIFRTFRTKELPRANNSDPIKPIILKIPAKSVSPVKRSKWDRVKPDIFKPTTSFLQYKKKESEPSEMAELPKDFRFRFRGKVLLPTISKKAKIRSKSEMNEGTLKPKWQLSGHITYELAESLYLAEKNPVSFQFKARTPSPDILKPKGITSRLQKHPEPSTWEIKPDLFISSMYQNNYFNP